MPLHAKFWQRGWLRWPLAWSLASATTLALLATLASSPRPWVRDIPARLTAVLQSHVPPAAPHSEIPNAPPITRPRPPQQQPAPSHSTVDATPLLTAATPATITEPFIQSPGEKPIAAESIASVSSTSSALPVTAIANSIPASPARLADMPLEQRCPQQIKPVFPTRAMDDDIEYGRTLARLHLESDGSVGSVQIIEAHPRGYFEAATRNAALQWKCLPSGDAGDSVRVPFIFQTGK